MQIFFEEFVARVGAARWADGAGPRLQHNAFVRGITEFPVTLERRG